MSRYLKEGVYKFLNSAIVEVNFNSLIVMESWKKYKARLQQQFPGAIIKYSYKTKEFTIEYNLPSDFKSISEIKIRD